VSASGRIVFRWVALALLALIVALQLRLWTGQGGMPDVWRLRERAAAQADENGQLRRRNEDLAADVQDLKTGQEAIEERARSELGMIKPGEVFYQVVEPSAGEAATAPASAPEQ
jgi:cell division protein FtsB